MRISPFYSTSPGIAVEAIWHNSDEGEIGLSIPPPARLAGKYYLRHCQYCQLLTQPYQRKTLPRGAGSHVLLN